MSWIDDDRGSGDPPLTSSSSSSTSSESSPDPSCVLLSEEEEEEVVARLLLPLRDSQWSAKESAALVTLRARLGDELNSVAPFPEVVGDRRLLRFLRGYDFDMDVVCARFVDFLRWRVENDVDSIRRNIVEKRMMPEDFPGAKQITSLMHIRQHHGFSHLGGLVGPVNFMGRIDPRRLLREVTPADFLLYNIYCMEYTMLVLEARSRRKEAEVAREWKRQQQQRRRPRRRKKTPPLDKHDDGGSQPREMSMSIDSILEREGLPEAGRRRRGHEDRTDDAASDGVPANEPPPKEWGVLLRSCVIRDVSGLGIQHAWRPGLQFMREVIVMMTANYPDVMDTCFIINVPWAFFGIWKLVRPILTQQTQKKIKILDGNFLEAMRAAIPDEHIPECMGGQCRCPSGGCIPSNGGDEGRQEGDDEEEEFVSDETPPPADAEGGGGNDGRFDGGGNFRWRLQTANDDADTTTYEIMSPRSATEEARRNPLLPAPSIWRATSGDAERLQRLPGAEWVPNSQRTHCVHCEQKFTIVLRRHHCRMCGEIVCAKCSPHRAKMEKRVERGSGKPDPVVHPRGVRLCTNCFVAVKHVKVAGRASIDRMRDCDDFYQSPPTILSLGLHDEVTVRLEELEDSGHSVYLRLAGRDGQLFLIQAPFEGDRWIPASPDRQEEGQRPRALVRFMRPRSSLFPSEWSLPLSLLVVSSALLAGVKLMEHSDQGSQNPPAAIDNILFIPLQSPHSRADPTLAVLFAHCGSVLCRLHAALVATAKAVFPGTVPYPLVLAVLYAALWTIVRRIMRSVHLSVMPRLQCNNGAGGGGRVVTRVAIQLMAVEE